MQTKSSLKKIFVIVSVIALVQFALPLKPRAVACPSPHGQFTSVLCDQESIVGDGAYLISPDTTVRLIMQAPPTGDGHIVSYRNGTPVFTFYGGTRGPARRLLAGTNQSPDGSFGYQLYDPSDVYLGVGGWQPGTSYLMLHDDACLYFHFADDSFNQGVCATGQ
jgi:hypothetical protein